MMHNDLTFDPALRAVVSPELRHGEKLLWIGKPTPLRVLMQQGDQEVLVAVLAITLLLFFAWLFPSFRTLMVYPLSLPFMLFAFSGLLYAILRPVYIFWQATRTIYAMSDQRALILKPTLRGRSIASYRDFTQVERSGLFDDKGDLIFARKLGTSNWRGGSARVLKIGFFGIPDVRRIEDLMLDNIPTAHYANLDD